MKSHFALLAIVALALVAAGCASAPPADENHMDPPPTNAEPANVQDDESSTDDEAAPAGPPTMGAFAEMTGFKPMTINHARVAVVITDPQNDFLSEDGVTWGVVGASVTENNTIANIEALIKVAKANDIPVFISPHYYYPTDKGWQFGGLLEQAMHAINMFDRKGALTTEGFEGSGADWLERYKPLINDGVTIVASPHKVYGPQNNDLVLQLRKRGVDQVVLGGMSANLCVESHLRELLEQGFEVMVVSDATAAAIFADVNGYEAAITNFQFIASAVRTTEQAVGALQKP